MIASCNPIVGRTPRERSMPPRSQAALLLAAMLAPATLAGAAPAATPSFEPVAAGKPQTAGVDIAPSPVSYGLEASIGADGRIAIRCRAGESTTYRRWREALAARSRDGAER
jgi:hypothetical protein